MLSKSESHSRLISAQRVIVVIASCLLILLLSGGAHADPIVWTLEDVTFDDGGTAIGSFKYDAGANLYSDVAITTTLGTSFVGAGYGDVVYQGQPTQDHIPTSLQLVTAGPVVDEYYLDLVFAEALTSLGGIVNVIPSSSFEGRIDGVFPPYIGDFVVAPLRIVHGGRVVAQPVPVPSAAILGVLGLGAAGLRIRRRSRHT